MHYAIRNKNNKWYATDETPENYFLDVTVLDWSDDVDKAIFYGIDDETADVFNIITQLCAEDAELKPSDFELVLVKTIVEPTKGQYAVEEIEQPEWFLDEVKDVEELNYPERRVSM